MGNTQDKKSAIPQAEKLEPAVKQAVDKSKGLPGTQPLTRTMGKDGRGKGRSVVSRFWRDYGLFQ